jgi:hypothetical protein
VSQTNTASTSTADLPLNSVSAPRFNNSEQIPRHEQDLDANRHRRLSLGLDSGAPEDGSEVVNLLSEPGLPGGEPSTPLSLEPESDASNLNFGDDMGMSNSSALPQFEPTSLPHMLYGPNSALSV